MSKHVDPSISPTNQQWIADELKISRTTVSRCFTNHPGISPVTRAKVFDLAAKVGYRHMEVKAPSKPAPSRRKTVGVLVCTELEEYFRGDYQSPGMRLLEGVSEFAQRSQLRLEVHYVSPQESALEDPSYQKVEALQKRQWKGVLLIYPFPGAVVDAIGRQFPMVSLVDQYGGGDWNCVDVDHYKGVSSMVDLMVRNGNRRMGFYTRTYPVEALWSQRRFSAFVEKMNRLGLRISEQDLVNVRSSKQMSDEKSFDHVAERVRAGVSAWVCAADHQAYDLIAGLKRRGLRAGKDFSVTGFDGIQKPDWAPELSTAVIPYREIGFTGAKRLLELIQKPFGSAHHILVASQVREGKTVVKFARAGSQQETYEIA